MKIDDFSVSLDWQGIWYNERHQSSETGGVTVARKEADRLKAPGAKTARLQTLRDAMPPAPCEPATHNYADTLVDLH